MPKPLLPSEDQAMQYALLVLGFRARSEQEMRQRLERKGFSPAVVTHTQDELVRLGLLDDREFARGWISAHPGRGAERLSRELQQKGIPRVLAEEVLHACLTGEDEWTGAWQLAQRSIRSLPSPLSWEALQRLRRRLRQRGFSYEVIDRVSAELRALDPVESE